MRWCVFLCMTDIIFFSPLSYFGDVLCVCEKPGFFFQGRKLDIRLRWREIEFSRKRESPRRHSVSGHTRFFFFRRESIVK